MRTIKIRTTPANGFWKDIKNKKGAICDHCGQKLWIGPGNTVYCNNWTPDHDRKEVK